MPGTPALQAGSITGAPSTDQRGFARIVNNLIDIGAFENQSQLFTLTPPASNPNPDIGIAASFSLGSFTESGSGTSWTVTVNWGDGTANTVFTTNSQGNLGTQSHTYATNAKSPYTVSVTVSDADSNFDQMTFPVSVNPPIVVSPISPTGLNIGTLGNGYSQQITASGGAGSYTFSTSSALDGLTLSNTGLLSGNPSAANSFPITITATDSDGGTGSQGYTLVINPAIVVSPTSATGLNIGTVGNAYTQTIAASGGAGGTYTFTTTDPLDGLTLSTGGVLSGSPTTDGPFNITVTATDSNHGTGSRTYSLVIDKAIVVSPTDLPAGSVGGAYSQTISAVEGSGTGYTFTTTAGALPTGLALSTAGILSGMSRVNGTFTFTVTATDSIGATGSHVYSITVASPLGTDPNALYVENVYGLLLHRAADSGAGYWVGQLDQGMSPSAFVSIIEGSAEYLSNVVTGVYQNYLNRTPDPAGLNYWVSDMQAGASVEQVIEGFIASPEFYQVQGGGTNGGFVTVFYKDILNRPPDPAGFQYWVNALTTGAISPAGMAWGFLRSLEYEGDLVSSYYSQYLRRLVDAGGFDYWTQQMQAGLSDPAVVAALLGSGEGFADWS